MNQKQLIIKELLDKISSMQKINNELEEKLWKLKLQYDTLVSQIEDNRKINSAKEFFGHGH